MRDDEKLDLSALDDLKDPARFERLVGSITRRALAARRPPSVWEQLTAWAWPALATAALVPLLVWGARLALPPPPASEPAVASTQAQLLLTWARGERAPSTADLLLHFPSGGARSVP